jgi:phosphoglycolate phosphatase
MTDPDPNRTEMPRAILFDWDNTLVENWLAIQAAMNAALDAAGHPPMDLDEVKLQARLSAREIFPRLFGETWQQARALYYAHFERNHLDGLRLMEGAEALLGVLGALEIPLAIVSNKRGDILRREIGHLGWNDRFRAVVGSLDAAADKPDPASIRLALSKVGVDAGADVWLVGDTDVDMRAAAAAGCLPVLVGPGPSEPTLLEGVEVGIRYRNCTELAGIARRQWSTICHS